MLGHSGFRVTPRRGELIVFDKLARGLVNHVLLPVPTEKTKGVLVSPTIYGNVLLGPTAEDIEDKTDRSTTAAGLASLMEAGARILPALEGARGDRDLRRAAGRDRACDYQLTRAPRPALRLRRWDPLDRDHRLARDRRVGAGGARRDGTRPGLQPETITLRMPNIGEFGSRPYQEGELIARDADYGRIVCFCERVTRGEIDAALASPIPPADVGRPASPNTGADGTLPGLLLRR